MRRAVNEQQEAAPETVAASSFSAVRSSTVSLAKLGKRIEGVGSGWASAASTLREVRAVPTIFPGVDAALGVGGWPTDRFGLIHGESNEGKSTFVLGLMLSFLLRGHAAALIDAERTTPRSWVQKLFPREQLENPGFQVLYPTSYEKTVDSVRAWCEAIGEAREQGEVPPDTTGIVVLDSLRKLVPQRLLDKLLKEGSEIEESEKGGRFGKKKGGGVDGMAGRAAQYKAALNAAWMDELTVLLAQTGTCLVAIGREYKADTGSALTFGDDFVLGGGGALFFESSVVARVGLDQVLYEGADGSKRMVGEKHFVQIRKTKIAGKERRYPVAHFHTSNGAEYAFGFDRGRDLLDVGRDCGVVEVNGSWYAFGGEKLGQGELAAARRLATEPELAERLEVAVRATFPGIEAVTPPAPPAPVKKSAPAKKTAAKKTTRQRASAKGGKR